MSCCVPVVTKPSKCSEKSFNVFLTTQKIIENYKQYQPKALNEKWASTENYCYFAKNLSTFNAKEDHGLCESNFFFNFDGKY